MFVKIKFINKFILFLYFFVKDDLFLVIFFVVRYVFFFLLDVVDEEEEENLISDVFGKNNDIKYMGERGEIIIY